jgi:hypothetical protein
MWFSDLPLAAVAASAQAAEVDGDGQAYKETAEGIEPGFVAVNVLAEGPWQQAEHKSDIGDLEQAAVFGVEAAIHGMHIRFSFSISVVKAAP